MNNFHRVLLYLKQFEGDGILHQIEHLFIDTSLHKIKIILEELSNEGLITFKGREEKSLSFIFTQNILTNESNWIDSPLNEHILNSKPEPYEAKITFKGSKYLKEELQMKDSNKYNISVTGHGAKNTFVIESNNVKIDNKTNLSTQVDTIIETIKYDNSITNEIKVKAINDLLDAKKLFNQNEKIPSELIKRILEYGSYISSIGQLVLGLFSS